MKTIITVLFCLAFVSGSFAQIGNKKKVFNSNIADLTGPLPIKKMKERDFKNKLVKDISKVATKEMKVAATYFNKRSQRSWKITPDRAFGSGNLGFSMYSGQLWKQFFLLEGDFRGGEPLAYVSLLTFDARMGRTYLIKITTGGANSSVYIYSMAGSIPFKVYGQNGSYPILIEANESGEMLVAISARYRVGQNERYPEPLPIKEITIDEL
tara:strand:+ start:15526 stop:16158 length:633 start_codon:yes stop_codon:yes gene_type:complete